MMTLSPTQDFQNHSHLKWTKVER